MEVNLEDGKFQTVSKGKAVAGTLPEAALEAIRQGCSLFEHTFHRPPWPSLKESCSVSSDKPSIPQSRPFAGHSAKAIECRLYRVVERLHREGRIAEKYSAHDFRHYFAVTEYRGDRNIHRLSRLLGHSGLAVTEAYLKGLNETV